MKTDFLIIGGGLCGLSLAEMLHSKGHDFILIEARDRFGGRIKTEKLDDSYFDLGPAWFWPGQPRIEALIERLKLTKFEQYYEGALSYENEQGNIQRERGFSSMQGSWRLAGGMAALIDGLASSLPSDKILLNTVAQHIEKLSDGIVVTLNGNKKINAKKVIFALPPRIAVSNISYMPELSKTTVEAAKQIPTWMAGQAKVVAVYETPFWRENGLSGDAMSRRGPLVEIHDASPLSGGPYGLFGFIGIPPNMRQQKEQLKTAVLEQFGRIFGEQALKPKQIFLKDWADDLHTSTAEDLQPLYRHPQYGIPDSLNNLWEGDLIFSGTETASRFGGYLEGAIEAAENTCHIIDNVNEKFYA